MIGTSRQALKTLFGNVDSNAEPQRIVSYLPLSHVAAQLVDIHGPMHMASTTYFAQPDALQGSLVQTLSEVRPTQFLGVPRVWEKIEEKVRSYIFVLLLLMRNGLDASDWCCWLGSETTYRCMGKTSWTGRYGWRRYTLFKHNNINVGTIAKLNNKSLPWGWHVANKLVFENVKKALGLDACKLSFTAAAPIGKKTMEYFMSLDNPLYEVYGMSECSGPHTVNVPGACKVGTVGVALHGVEIKLADMDAKNNGEICMRGRHVFMGYLHNSDATMGSIDEEGWLHSGDVGALDTDGFLKITGRIKELIITAGGENVPPVCIEDIVKEELPAVSNVMVIG